MNKEIFDKANELMKMIERINILKYSVGHVNSISMIIDDNFSIKKDGNGDNKIVYCSACRLNIGAEYQKAVNECIATMLETLRAIFQDMESNYKSQLEAL